MLIVVSCSHRFCPNTTAPARDMHPPDYGPVPMTTRENLSPQAVTASPDGTTFAAVLFPSGGDHNELFVWNADRKKPCRLRGTKPTEVDGVAFSPNGRTLVSVGGRDWNSGVVYFWNTGTWAHRTRTVGLRPGRVAFSPDGSLLAVGDVCTGGDHTKIAFLAPNGQLIRRFGNIYSGIEDLTFSPDGRSLAVAHRPELSVWSTRGRLRWRQSGHEASRIAFAYSPDGTIIASCDETTTILRDAATGTPRHFLKGHIGNVCDLAFSPDGALLATAGWKGIKLWDTHTGRERLILQADYLIWVGFWPTPDTITAVDINLRLFGWNIAELLKHNPPSNGPVAARLAAAEQQSSSEQEAVLEAIFDLPEDDTPRLAYADWLDEHGQSARAEFIRVQVELAQLAESREKRTKTQEKRITKLAARVRELLDQHSDEWLAGLAAIQPVIDETEFERGFLARVRMTGIAVTDDHLRHLAGAPEIQELTLDDSRVTDEGLARLKPLRNLRELRLSNTAVTPAALKRLAVLPKLVEVYHYDWGHRAIPEFETFKIKRNRRLNKLPQEERRAEALRSLRYLGDVTVESGRLVGVRFSQTRTTDADLAYLREFPEIEWLHFSETWALTSAGLNHLRGLTALKQLHLVETGITTLEPLRHMVGLEELWVWSTATIEPDTGRFLASLPRLKILSLFNCELGDAIMPHLGKFLGLEELNLTENEITDAGLEHLAGLKKLKKLEVDYEKDRKALIRRLLRR